MTVYQDSIHVNRIDALGGGEWFLRNLADVTVLFGKNGSGKSLLLREWRDQSPAQAHYVAPERTGELRFNPKLMQEQLEATGRREKASRNAVPDYREQVISRIQTYFLRRGEMRDGVLPGHPSELEELLSQLIPDFTVTIQARNPPYEIVRLSNGERIRDVDRLSSGEAQLFTVALDILTMAAIWELESKHDRILLIDEPDAHIHPDLQIRLADFVLNVCRRFDLQVVVATHSTTLLSALGQFGGTSTAVIYVDRLQEELRAQVFDDVHRELAACLGGHALMGPLFAAPLLIVEGDDDYRIWSQVPRHHIVRVCVLPANGDEIHRYQRILERIFASLRDPSEQPIGFALLDGDKTLPQETPDVPQQFIKYLKLECREAENLFLADEVLADLETAWPEAATKIVAEAGLYGNKADFLRTATDWDRSSIDLKRYIGEISKILDSKNVHWTIRVGSRIGRGKPTGQLADFLGPNLIASFW
jgi:predicted ATPase